MLRVSSNNTKQRGNSIAALLTNMAQANKVLNDSVNSDGSAMQEQDRWAESLDAKLQQLNASFQALSNTAVNSDFLKVLIESGTALNNVFTELIQNIGIIPTVTTGVGLASFVKYFNDLKVIGEVSNLTKEFNGVVTAGSTSYSALANVLKAVDNQAKINIVSQSSLTQEQKLCTLSTAGLTTEELKAAVANKSLSVAQSTTKLSTVGLTTALKGLWTTMLANPLLIVGMAITAGISAWNMYKQSVEEMRQSTSEAAGEFGEASSSIQDYANKYKALHDELVNVNTTEERQHKIKSNLISLQQELNDKYGDEYGKLNLVTDAYKDQTNAILAMNKAAAQRYLNENVAGVKDAQTQMTKDRSYILAHDVNANSDSGNAILALAKSFGIDSNTDESTGTFTLRIKADASNANDVINQFMNEVSALRESYGNDDSNIDSVLGVSTTALKESKKIIDKFSESYNKSLIAEITGNDKLSSSYENILSAVKVYNDALGSGDENKILSARESLKLLKSSIDMSSNDWGKYSSVINDTFAHADTGLYDFNDALKSNQDNLMAYARSLNGMSQEDLLAMNNDGQEDNFDKLVDSAKEYGLSAETVISILQKLKIVQTDVGKTGENAFAPLSKQDVIANINSLSEGFESLDKIMNSMKGENPFDYALLDDKKFKDTFGELGDVYTNFVEKISSSPKNIKGNQDAFNSLVTAWIDSSGVLSNLTDENSNLVTSMLKNMGVANAEEVVTDRLAVAHEKLAAEKYYNENASDSLNDATMSEIDAFVNEGIAAGVSQQAMSLLALEKLSVNDIKIDTASDIDQVIALANAAGASTSALDQLARAKAAFASIDSAIAKGTAQLANPSLGSPIAAGLTMATEMLNSNTMAQISEAQKTLEDIENGTYDYGINLNPDNFKKATYGGGTKTNKAGGSGKDKSKKDTSEVFDWVSVVIERTKEKVEDLQNQINDTSNWKPKNALTDTAISEMSKQLEALQSQADTYQNEANKYSANLSPTYIDKIKNGTLEIETVTDEVMANNIKSYQEWYNKAEDVGKQIDETKKSMKELAKSKLDNIINDFDSLVSLMDKYSSYSESLIQLQEELGESISDVDYNGLIKQQETIYNELQSKYDSLSKELSKAVSSGSIKVGTDEWRKYQSELVGVNSEMNETVSSINKFRQSMVNLSFQDLEKFADATDRINNGFETMTNLIGSDGLMKDSMITSKGLAQIAIYGKQLSNAKQQAAEYANAIDSLNEMYENGSLTQSEYNERLNEYTSAQLSAAQATKDARQAILEFRYNAIQAQIDDMNDLISAKKEALQAEKDYQDYLEEVNGKQTDIANLQKKIEELSLSGKEDRRAYAQKLQLEEELKKAKDDLADTQANHAFDKTLESLDKQGEEYEKAKNDELDTLKSNTNAQEKVIEDYLGQVKDNYKTVYGTLTQYGTDYNITMTDELTSPWDSAGSAVETFQSAVSDAISQINIDIANIDLSKLTEMVSTMSGFSANGSGASFEDVTSDGTWQKTSKGWWYGNSNDDYVSDGVYTIGGKQYNFNEDGYMKSGWDESSGAWRYFEPENGQMVKSAWRKSKDGKDYYLKSDGSMATDMAVKSKSGDGYYYLDDDGVWDGNLLSSDEVKQRKITVGYKNGTQDSKSGLKYVNEDGPEMIVTKDGTVLNSAGGDTIFPNDMVEKLWSMADNPIKYMLSNMPSFDYNSIPAGNQNNNNINLDVQFNVQGDANKNTLAECKNMLEDYGKKELPKVIAGELKRF